MSALRDKIFPTWGRILDWFLFFLILTAQTGRISLWPWGVPVSWGRSIDNLLVSFVVLWLVWMIASRSFQVKRSEWDPPIWALMIVLALSVGHLAWVGRAAPAPAGGLSPPGEVIKDGWENFREMLAGWAMFLAVISRLSSRRHLARLRVVLGAGIAYVGIAGLVRYASGIYFHGAPYRLSTASLHPNGVGVYLAMVFPICLVWSVLSPRWSGRVLWSMLGLLTVASLALTFSRTSWIACCFGTVFLIIRARNRLLRCISLGIVCLALGGVLFHPALRRRALTVGNWSTDLNIQRRLTYVTAAARMMKDHPLGGVGYGSLAFRNAYLQHYKVRETGEDVRDPHNLFLNLAAGAGLPALAAFLWLVAAVWFDSWRNLDPAPDGEIYGWRLAFLTGFFTFLVVGMAESPFYSSQLMAFFWSFLALGAIVNGRVRLAALPTGRDRG